MAGTKGHTGIYEHKKGYSLSSEKTMSRKRISNQFNMAYK